MIIKRNSIAPFVGKLVEIFKNDQFSRIIDWTKTQITIKDPDQFVSLVLPQYFRHVKLESFIRQLNLYGFNKVPTNNKSLVFKHEHFEKGMNCRLRLVQLKSKLKDIKQRQQQYISDPLFSNRIKFMLQSSSLCFQICLFKIKEKLCSILKSHPQLQSECKMALFMINSSIAKDPLYINNNITNLQNLMPF